MRIFFRMIILILVSMGFSVDAVSLQEEAKNEVNKRIQNIKKDVEVVSNAIKRSAHGKEHMGNVSKKMTKLLLKYSMGPNLNWLGDWWINKEGAGAGCYIEKDEYIVGAIPPYTVMSVQLQPNQFLQETIRTDEKVARLFLSRDEIKLLPWPIRCGKTFYPDEMMVCRFLGDHFTCMNTYQLTTPYKVSKKKKII